MPSRHTAREDSPGSYYHVFARGASKQAVYKDDADKDYFLHLFGRHLGIEEVVSRTGYRYPNYRGEVELLCYCLMDNHFHLLVYQHDQGSLARLMKSIMTAYSAYFNRRYMRSGSLFESRYKSSRITSDSYLLHISRYIHLNPRSWRRFRYSSLRQIQTATEPEWLQSNRLLELHPSRQKYLEFVADYEDNKQALDRIKHDLANL